MVDSLPWLSLWHCGLWAECSSAINVAALALLGSGGEGASIVADASTLPRLCLWYDGCQFGQFVSAMKVSVGVNLLAGVWIWLHKQSEAVQGRIDSELGGLVGVTEREHGGDEVSSRTQKIAGEAEQAVRRHAMRGIVLAALCTLLILLVAFFVNGEYQVTSLGMWALALVLALAGPIVMLVTYVCISMRTSKALREATVFVNNAANNLKKPEAVPTIRDPTP